jgi:hypothetical protein
MWIKAPVRGKATLPGCVRWEAKFGSQGADAESVWFEVPESIASQLNPAATPWLQAVLPLAVRHGESLEADCDVDPVWLQNAKAAMDVWSRWFPELKPVEIRTSGIQAPVSIPNARKTGLFFTGGVDSFYSLLHYDRSAASNPHAKLVDDLIYVCGYDIPLENSRALKNKIAALQLIADRLDKNLVIITTNLRETRLNELDWGMVMHGPALGAAGLLLESRWDTLLISAGGCIEDVTPWGSHPLTDPLMSTGLTRVIRYSNNVTRFAKTEFLSKSQIALDHLHVCWVRNSEDNCGECEKCVRTMLMLEVLGVLDKAACFPQGPILEKLRTIQVTSPLAVPLWEDIKAPAFERGRKDVVREIDRCLERSLAASSAPSSLLRGLERKIRNARKKLLG